MDAGTRGAAQVAGDDGRGRRETPPDPPPAEPFDRLRRDVHLLGELVGEVLREQGGPELLAAVEYIRTAAIALRADVAAEGAVDPAREAALLDWIGRQSNARLLEVVRAFSVYFHLINLAEEHHRVRTLAERERAGGPPVENGVSRAGGGGTPETSPIGTCRGGAPARGGGVMPLRALRGR